MTPVIAVYKELQKRFPADLCFEFICDKQFIKQAQGLFAGTDVKIDIISAGKLRRYTGLKWWQKLSFSYIKNTYFANFVDIFKILRGYVQVKKIVRRFQPDVLFVKGGYVSLPAGRAAHKLGVPIVVHDSDVVPGLTNRVLSKIATKISTGSPVENYPSYDKAKTEFVGVPIDPQFFQPIKPAQKREFLDKYGLKNDKKLVLVTGGGSGSEFLNKLVFNSAQELVDNGIQILLLAGKGNLNKVDKKIKGLVAVEFIDGMMDAIRSADLVVSRAGASILAELAAASKPTILIPHPHLSGNHQTKNTTIYAKKKASIVMRQGDLTAADFTKTILRLLNDETELVRMGMAIRNFARPDAIGKMVNTIIEVANGKQN